MKEYKVEVAFRDAGRADLILSESQHMRLITNLRDFPHAPFWLTDHFWFNSAEVIYVRLHGEHKEEVKSSDENCDGEKSDERQGENQESCSAIPSGNDHS